MRPGRPIGTSAEAPQDGNAAMAFGTNAATPDSPFSTSPTSDFTPKAAAKTLLLPKEEYPELAKGEVVPRVESAQAANSP